MIFVKPAKDGLRVRHPEKLDYIIPKEGTWVNESTEFLRLINHGDLVVDTNKTPPVDAKKTKATKEGGAR